ncbi:MAG: methionyl-tRNA formyltransferase [Flavobacteriaceae bacterium]|nr:methionyl-tRNA formyltransferase [Flavobacteriaceae bacterium]
MNSLSIIFMGTPDFAVRSLDAIISDNYKVKAVITAPDKKAGRGKKINCSEVKKYALEKNLKLLQPHNLKEENFINELKSIKADLFVVVAFRMLPKIVWEIPKFGTINLHASLLPQLRGAAPIHWAIIKGLQSTGVSTFFINEKIDFGNIIEQREVEIGNAENTGNLYQRLKEIGSQLILTTLKQIISGKLITQKQIESKKLLKAPKLVKENTRINWNKSGLEIFNFIRGLSPHPTAWTKSEKTQKTFKLYNVIYFKEKRSDKLNGIINMNDNLMKISVNDGYLKVLELQIEGKKKMSVQEFINGYKSYNLSKLI